MVITVLYCLNVRTWGSSGLNTQTLNAVRQINYSPATREWMQFSKNNNTHEESVVFNSSSEVFISWWSTRLSTHHNLFAWNVKPPLVLDMVDCPLYRYFIGKLSIRRVYGFEPTRARQNINHPSLNLSISRDFNKYMIRVYVKLAKLFEYERVHC